MSSLKIILDTDDCGTRKNCYISPNDCDVKRDNCIFVLKWDFDGEYINYDLKAVTSDWINIVFSDDKAAVIQIFFVYLDLNSLN